MSAIILDIFFLHEKTRRLNNFEICTGSGKLHIIFLCKYYLSTYQLGVFEEGEWDIHSSSFVILVLDDTLIYLKI